MEPINPANIEFEFTVERSSTLVVDEIELRTELSKIRIKDAMKKGAVWVTRKKKTARVRRAKAEARIGDIIAIYYDEKILNTEPPTPELIVDKGQYSVRYKPAGLMSSGSRFGDHCAINRWIETTEDRPAFLVHRLDQFTTGLMVIAHSKKSAAHLSNQFQQRKTKKIYKVIVEGNPEPTFTIAEPLDGKEAVSHITTIESENGLSLVEVKIETGRKHQIRRHLASVGYPVVGDRQYGGNRYPELQLTAVELGFTCPIEHQFESWRLEEKYHPQLKAISQRT